MKGFLIKWAVNIAALIAVVHIVPGIYVDRLETVIVAALILGLINAFFKPFLILLTLPINILSLGLFTFVINGFMLYMASWLVRGFSIAGFWNAFWGALFFSIISFLLNIIISPKGRVEFRYFRSDYTDAPKYRDAIDTEGKPED